MRTWRNLAAPDDPTARYDVDGVWPTPRGTYETADYGSLTNLAATSGATEFVRYAFQALTLSGSREYALTNTDAGSTPGVWEYAAGALTARTISGNMSLYPMMAQYGTVTVLVKGASNTTNSGTGGNFSALAGAPNGEIVCVLSNAVVILNTGTSTDGWHASDVGDYTNWTTGESASGRLIATPGQIVAGCTFGDAVYAFKENSIYRIRYVGGSVKWMTELVWVGVGCRANSSSVALKAKYYVCAGSDGMIFCAGNFNDGAVTGKRFYRFDGTSPPQHINPETVINDEGPITYNPITNTYNVWGMGSSGTFYLYYYCGTTGAWGRHISAFPSSSSRGSVPVVGEFAASGASFPSNMPVGYGRDTVDLIYRIVPDFSSASSVCYFESTMFGRPDRKTRFDMVIPLLRRRRDIGTDSAALSFVLWRERHSSSAQSTRSVTESTVRNRFDLQSAACVDNFARFKITYTALDVEMDDIQVVSLDAGAN